MDLTDNNRLTDPEASKLLKKLCRLPILAAFQKLPHEKQERHI